MRAQAVDAGAEVDGARHAPVSYRERVGAGAEHHLPVEAAVEQLNVGGAAVELGRDAPRAAGDDLRSAGDGRKDLAGGAGTRPHPPAVLALGPDAPAHHLHGGRPAPEGLGVEAGRILALHGHVAGVDDGHVTRVGDRGAAPRVEPGRHAVGGTSPGRLTVP